MIWHRADSDSSSRPWKANSGHHLQLHPLTHFYTCDWQFLYSGCYFGSFCLPTLPAFSACCFVTHLHTSSSFQSCVWLHQRHFCCHWWRLCSLPQGVFAHMSVRLLSFRKFSLCLQQLSDIYNRTKDAAIKTRHFTTKSFATTLPTFALQLSSLGFKCRHQEGQRGPWNR